MATISKFYLRNAATPNTGIMPGTGDPFFNAADGNGDATGGRTARDATDTIGSLQTSSLITATADQNRQQWGHRRFVSRPLAATTFAIADGNWTFSYARSESNTLHNGILRISVYPWRPSTGAQVGSPIWVSISGTAMSSTSEVADSVTGPWSGTVSILAGDILVFEVYDNFVQGMSTAYTSTFFYDGTTEASTTSCASFVTPPAALTLFDSSTLTAPIRVTDQAVNRSSVY